MRATYGFENPNEAAMLLVGGSLLAAHLFFGISRVRALGWVALVAGAIAVQPTLSRTAMYLLVAATAVGTWARKDFQPRDRRIGVALAVVMLGFFLAAPGSGRRLLEKPTTDGSALARVEMWQSIPALIRANSAGWGANKAGNAYTEWFQDVSDTRTYRTLISSHLTFVVEMGWWRSCLYVLAWSAALGASGHLLRRGRFVGVGLVVVVYYIAAAANRVLETEYSRGLVLACAVTALAAVTKLSRVFPLKPIGGLIALQCVGLGVWVMTSPRPPLQVTAEYVTFGEGPTGVLVLGTPDVLGQRPGRVLRGAGVDIARFRFIFPRAPELSLPKCEYVVVAGSDAALKSHLGRNSADVRGVVLLNAGALEPPPSLASCTMTYRGSFVPSAAREGGRGRETTRIVPGAGKYLARWPHLVVEAIDEWVKRRDASA